MPRAEGIRLNLGDTRLYNQLRRMIILTRVVRRPLWTPGVAVLVGISRDNKASKIGVVYVANLGVLHVRLIPRVLGIRNVRDTLPRGEQTVRVEV